MPAFEAAQLISGTSGCAAASITMARYFFHTQTDRRGTDEEGIELSGDAEARREAIRASGEMMRDCPEPFWGTRPWTVTVTNAGGLVLYEIVLNGYATPDAAA